MDLDAKEKSLQARLEAVEALEREVKRREREVKAREGAKKQVLLRLSPSLWNEIAQWAEDDFRSINGQIEFLLSDAVAKHRKK